MRKILQLLILIALLMPGWHTYAQDKVVSGVVTADDGSVLPGVNITVKGTTRGVSTDTEGKYSISAPASATLVYSFVGYLGQSIVVGSKTTINVTLVTDAQQLGEVVVTALGISREKKSLGYSTATITNTSITEARNTSPLDALNARVPGLSVSTASGAPGASTVLNIRGFNSVTGNNQPLYVVDGVPMNNRGNSSSTTAANSNDDFNRSMDFGNQMNDINPNEIESITVLKGISASALYGSRAANGAILITTKRGKSGKTTVDFSSSFAQSQILRVPHLQNTYGQGWSGLFDPIENGSWGPKMDGSTRLWGNVVDNSQLLKPFAVQEDNLKDFFDRGYEWNNSIAVSGGTETANYRVSYSNAMADGVVPTNADSYKRNTLSLNGGLKLGKFSVNSNINYVHKHQKAVATGQGDDAGGGKVVWQEIIQIPRDHSIVDSKAFLDPNNPFGKFMDLDNYFTPYAQNPYWTLYNQGNNYDEDRIFGNIEFGYQLLPSLGVQWRVGGDYSDAFQKDWGNVGRITPGTPNSTANNVFGSVAQLSRGNRQFNSDLIFNFKHNFGTRFDVQAFLGHNLNERSGLTNYAKVTNLDLPGFYSLSNSSVTPITFATTTMRRLVGVYGSATFGFDSWLYLTVGARNDWSSTLPKGKNSYFYPSASISAVLSEAFKLPAQIPFVKVRFAAASAGNDADPYQVYSVYVPGSVRAGGFGNINFPFGGVNAYEVSNNPGNLDLKPEISQEFEAGLELGFFGRRVGLDLSVYDKLTKNQIISLNLEPATGATAQTVNLGSVRNQGLELALNLIPVRTADFEWGVTLNYNKIKNEVESLGLEGGSGNILLNSSYNVKLRAVVGKPLGAIYSPDVRRDPDGNVVVNPETGLPLQSTEETYRGSINPNYTLGLSTYLTYKGFKLSANGDYRNGGVFYSYTARLNYFNGNAYNTQYNDREPWVIPGSVVQQPDNTYTENTTPISRADVYTYYGGTTSYEYNHVLPKTFFKLRNVSLTYSVPKSFLAKSPVRVASVGVFGRNLVLWTPKGNHFTDPEANTFGTSLKNLYGEFASGPSVATYGAQLNLSF
ncbi:SusC/RagA family TonB-linked outer membrane protein [Dyadobacter pollutisoli]|uniref:SusC/RagA family TonB-linked outer membrane protein n=1 Tax=Dyadobacter pollutisoli TaxID=2910158 RepID=A0A9E8SJE2_9BACT|nr:SusC/RagA family TonB-linked outer membrane protein [Dyadobacter pollutisoli]WAC09631.1 SusC/RagA family TonB-linked outer membrane protein [Dyadobacter pollutisoli]